MKLTIKNLEFIIDNKKILNDVGIEVPKGSFVGIIGPNGSGKSTLLKNIYRVYKPKRGEIILDGKAIHLAIRKVTKFKGMCKRNCSFSTRKLKSI